MRKNSSEFITSFISEAGTFKSNKDYFAYMELDDLACWIAADGIDSDEELESAEMAVKSIFSDFSEKPAMSRRKIKKYIKNAHKLLKTESRSVRLKASLIMIVTDYSRIIWATAGNARLYHFRKGRFNFKSKDQSVAQMIADAGKITGDEIGGHEERNNLTNYLGKQNGFKPFVSGKYKLYDGDTMVLCTPGCWENIDSIEMTDALSEITAPEELVDSLEEFLLGKQNKVLNNYTIAAVFANKVFKENPKQQRQLIKKVVAVVISLALVAGGIFAYKKVQAVMSAGRIRADIVKFEKVGDGFVKDGSYQKALTKYEDAQNKLNSIKDPDQESGDRLEKKAKITQLIIDGDTCYKAKDYYGAKSNYQKAGLEIEKDNDYDKAKLEEKMQSTQKFINVMELEKEGDELAGNDLEGALGKYKEAKDDAELIFFEEKVQELETKIRQVQVDLEKLKTTEQQLRSAKNYEKLGDDAYRYKNYAGAINNYETASSIYQELKKTDDNARVKNKVTSTNQAIADEAAKSKAKEEAEKAKTN